MSPALHALDATAQAELIRSRQLTPLELVETAIARIESLNPTLNAVIHTDFERARERAASAELPDGPFRGVPTLLKDIGAPEAGSPHHAGMAYLKRAAWVEKTDAYFTARSKAAGLIPLGRTNTPELAILPTTEPAAYGATRNPWSLEYSAGGSSGGAGAAVASGMVAVAHASDGGGSIRGPASINALVGLKPTRARISFGPGVGERWSGFSAEFYLTRSVRDAALLLDCVAGPGPGDPYYAEPPAEPYSASSARAPKRLRVGLMRQAPRGIPLHAECLAATERTARALEDLGHDVEEAYPEALDDFESVINYSTIVATNTARALAAWSEKVGTPLTQADVEPLTWALAERGRSLGAIDHLKALEFVHAFGRRLATWWTGGFDVLLTPTQASPPPKLGVLVPSAEDPWTGFAQCAPYGVFTLPFNLSGQPAISVPSSFTSNGLPLGVQLVGAYGREDVLLALARQLEVAAPWADRSPAL